MRKNNKYCLPVILLLIISVFMSCSDDDSAIGPCNLPGPSNAYPTDRMTDAPLILSLCWSYTHAPSDTVLFDVYLGTANPPPLVDSMITDTTYDPGVLLLDTTYFWRVIVHCDAIDSVSSPVWRFTTRSTFVFPLAIGNTWQYSRTFYSHNFDPDSLAYFGSDTVFGNQTTEIERLDTLLGSQETYVFHTMWTEDNGSSGDGYFYRNNTSNGLYEYAYESVGGVGPPKVALSEGTYLLFKGMRFNSISEFLDWVHSRIDITVVTRSIQSDSIRYENPPLRDLAYPLEVGQCWVYRDGEPWRMEKEVVGIESVTTPAIVANCFKIRWYWDIDNDGVWDTDIVAYDYLAAIGVLKRQYEFIGLTITDYHSSDNLGTCDFTDVYELTDFKLK